MEQNLLLHFKERHFETNFYAKFEKVGISREIIRC